MRKRNIILVDDEPAVLSALQRILHNVNYNLIMCASVAEAKIEIEKMRDLIDVVISDNRMPECSGVDFLSELRRVYPEIVRIMLTGHSDLEDAKKAINDGQVYRFLLKPCDADEMRTTVRHALAHKDLWEENRTLLKKVEEHEKILNEIETKYPGIMEIKKDSLGIIEIEDDSTSLDDFLKKYF